MEFRPEAVEQKQEILVAAVSHRRLTSWLLTSTILGCASLGLSSPTIAQQSVPASAQSRAVQFSIPAQPLPTAINAFIRATGWQVGYSTRITDGHRSTAVAGSMPPAQALRTLLSGTGINVRLTGANTATLVAPSTAAAGGALPAGAIPLDTIDVQGAGNPNSTMTPMPAYAGGQVATGGQVGMLGNRNVMNTPFSQTSYTNKTIQDQQARTVQDVLANDASVLPSAGSFDAESIRGFQNNSQWGGRSLNGLAGMAPLQHPSIDYIDRVEVLKGPNALLNGMAVSSGGNLGGAVNLVTKQAGDEPLTQLTTRYSSRSQVGAHVDVGRRFGDNKEFGIRFNGAYSGGDTEIKSNRSEFGTAALNLDYRGERVRLSADVAHQDVEFSAPQTVLFFNRNTLPYVPTPPNSRTSLTPSWLHDRQKSTLGILRGEVDILDNVTAYAAIGAQKVDQYGPSSSTTVSLLDASGRYNLSTAMTRNSWDVLSMQGGVRATVETGPVAHALNLNLAQSHFTQGYIGGPGNNYIINSIYNPVFPSAPALIDPGAPPKLGETKTSSIGIADTLSILNERIQFTAGIRYQTVGATNFDTTTGLVTSDYYSTAWSPAFGLVVKPWENVSLYANYIQGLEPGERVDTSYANGGQLLAPYVSKQYETGVKVDWGTVTTTVALFQIARPSAVGIPDAGGGPPTLALDGEQVNRGIELSAYGELIQSVRLLTGVTFLDARQTKTLNGAFDGERAQSAPAVRAVIGGEWDTPFVNGLTLTGRFTYTSDQVISNRRPDLTIPSWTSVDLGARYTFDSPWNAKPITIRFNVDNVFDNNNWKGALSGATLYRFEPRTYRLSTMFNF